MTNRPAPKKNKSKKSYGIMKAFEKVLNAITKFISGLFGIKKSK